MWEKNHTDLCRWRLLHKSLWWGRGLEDLLGDGRPRAWEAPCGELLACRGNDVARLLGWLCHEGRWVDRTRWGLRSLPRGLPAQAHLGELCGHIVSLHGNKQEISKSSLVMGEAHRGRPRPHACHCGQGRAHKLETKTERNSLSRATREHNKGKQILTIWRIRDGKQFDEISLFQCKQIIFH